MDKDKKDNIVILFIFYFTAFCFWLGNHRGIYTQLDLYLFIIPFIVLCVLPIVVIEIKNKKEV